MRVIALDTPASLAAAVASLPAPGPLPARTVLVPSERHAHAIRRALVRSGHEAALAGTRFVGPLTAAMEILHSAGVGFSPGEEALRPARLLSLFREGLPLEHFDPALLRTTRGWDEAFASAIGDLEAAGLSPGDLPADAGQARDLALLWTRVATAAGTSWTRARVLLEAAARVGHDPRAWPFDGSVVAIATAHDDTALARFLVAIPGVTLALRSAPVGARALDRVERLYGAEARDVLERCRAGLPAPIPAPRERDLLAKYLFADSNVLAAQDRPRSAGPDGTVDLEEHAGVEAELEATATWVSRQVLEAGRPLEEIAVLIPARDPLAQLVADRLEQLTHGGEALPVYVAGGLPAIGTAAGARVLAVLRALEAWLSAETLAEVLPALRLECPPSPDASEPALPRAHLTHGEAMEIAYGLGTAGGNAAHPSGALEWSARATARVPELEAALAHARMDEDSSARETRRLERTLRNLRAVRPAFDALVGVARAVVASAPLAELWEVLSGFLGRWLLTPGEGAPIAARLDESLAPACASALGNGLSGRDALAVIEDHLLSSRIPRGRFGEPAVYVGTVAGAAGLEFDAVRLVGLCEGVLPSNQRENPVLPERLRDRLERAAPGRVLPRAQDHVAGQVGALHAAIRGARDAVALSAPHVDLARTEREPASLFIDAAAALARPDASTGAPAEPVPRTAGLARDYFHVATTAAAAFRAARPVSDAMWLERVSRLAADLPPEWRREPVLELERIEALRSPCGRLGPADGVLRPGEPFPVVPGTDPERPISASALQQLLQCPRMFLMRRILSWDEPAEAPPLRELDAASFGTLVHQVVEAFYREHGESFVRGERSLAHWQKRASELADRELDAFLSEYPLVGAGVRTKERDRLQESVRAFLEYDWGTPGRRYVGVELPFGTQEEPLAITADGITLHVTGFIDRVDVEGGTTLVRDLKSGKAYPRAGKEKGPTPIRDVQLGLYQLAATKLASRWGTPRRVEVAYAYASGRVEVQERAFRGGDAPVLAKATKAWLETAAHLLTSRAFPATPHEEDCEFCPFEPLCGSAVPRRAREALAEEDEGALARYRALELGDEEEEP